MKKVLVATLSSSELLFIFKVGTDEERKAVETEIRKRLDERDASRAKLDYAEARWMDSQL